jgi:hypothetical protein
MEYDEIDEIDETDTESNLDLEMYIDFRNIVKENVLKKVVEYISKVGKEKVRENISDDEMEKIVKEIINEEVDIVWELLRFDMDLNNLPFSVPSYTGKKWKKFRMDMGKIQRKR